MTFILEYSQKQGGFHHNNGTSPEGSFGWETIAKDVTNKKAFLFEAFFDYEHGKKYPLVYIRAKWKAFEAFLEKQKECETIFD